MRNVCEVHGLMEDSWDGYLPKSPHKNKCFHCFLARIEHQRAVAYNDKESNCYGLPTRPTTRQLWNAFVSTK